MARAVVAGPLGEVVVAHAERLVAVGPDTVVKVNRDVAAHRREAAVLALLAAGGTGAPAVRSVAESADPPAGVLVLERVPGDPLGEHGEEDPRFGTACWGAAGAALARFHACPVEPPGPGWAGLTDRSFAAQLPHWEAGVRRHGLDHGWLAPAAAARLADLVAGVAERAAARPEALIHGDCSPQHWLAAGPEGPVRPIDVGDTGMGDPVYDLVVLTLTQPHRLEVVLDGYGADADLRAHLAATSPGYRALRLASEVMWLVDHSFDPAPARTRLRSALGASS